LALLEALVGTEDTATTVRRALDWMDAGLDFADAFHLALSERTDKFLSFDANLSRRAARLGARPAVAAP